MSNKSYSIEAGKKAIEEYLTRNNIKGDVYINSKVNSYLVKYGHVNPKVSIIIPMRDSVDVTKRCIESLFKVNTYKNFEIIIADNQSRKKETLDYLNMLITSYKNVKVVRINDEFNYSKINNFATKHASGDFYLLLNNDTEVKSPDFID